MMDNIKRCDWCFHEYTCLPIRNNDPNNPGKVCSLKCLYEIYGDKIEDKKLERKLGK